LNFFNVISSILALITYSQYLKQTIEKSSKPNPATWLIWVVVSFLNSFTFSIITSSFLQASFLWIITTFTIIIFTYSLVKGRFSKLTHIEIISISITIVLLIFYFLTNNIIATHFSLQIVYVISYIPTVIGIIRKTNLEKSLAWIFAFLTYLFALIALIYKNETDWIKYIHIVINGLIGNGIIITLSYKYREH
jgi:hypothetical protein